VRPLRGRRCFIAPPWANAHGYSCCVPPGQSGDGVKLRPGSSCPHIALDNQLCQAESRIHEPREISRPCWHGNTFLSRTRASRVQRLSSTAVYPAASRISSSRTTTLARGGLRDTLLEVRPHDHRATIWSVADCRRGLSRGCFMACFAERAHCGSVVCERIRISSDSVVAARSVSHVLPWRMADLSASHRDWGHSRDCDGSGSVSLEASRMMWPRNKHD